MCWFYGVSHLFILMPIQNGFIQLNIRHRLLLITRKCNNEIVGCAVHLKIIDHRKLLRYTVLQNGVANRIMCNHRISGFIEIHACLCYWHGSDLCIRWFNVLSYLKHELLAFFPLLLLHLISSMSDVLLYVCSGLN